MKKIVSSVTTIFLLCLFVLTACSTDDGGPGADGDADKTADGDSDSSAPDGDADTEIPPDGDNGEADMETTAEVDAEPELEPETDIICPDNSGIPSEVIEKRSIENLRQSGFIMERCVWSGDKSSLQKTAGDEEQSCTSWEDCPDGRCVERWDGSQRCFDMEACESDEECASKPNGHCIDDNDGNSICVYDECGQDSDCTANSYGRCIRNEYYPHSGLICVYHACQTDEECATGEACFCRDNTSKESSCGAKTRLAVCVESCRSSDECGDGNFCISAGQAYEYAELADCGSGMQAGGFRCTSPADECGCCTDSEACAYDDAVGHFVCKQCEEYEGDCPD